MKPSLLALGITMGLCLAPFHADAGTSPPVAAPVSSAPSTAQELAEGITDVPTYLSHLQSQVVAFEAGELGRPSRVDRRRLESASNQIRGLLEGHSSATELNPRNQVALFNAQEEFDAVILDYTDPVVCVRERRTGSHFVRNTCRRQSEIELRRNADQREMHLRPQAPPET